MAKLRKMLGSLEDPNIVSLMSLIETQSKTTLANWAITYAEDNFLKIYEKNYSDDLRLRNILSASKEYLNGTKKLNEVKPLIKEGNVVAKSLEENPVTQAACRAIVTACGTINTPTNALGFTFYGAAAIVYDKCGLSESSKIYDELASKELEKMLESLEKVAIPNEENPAKIKWNC